MIIGIVGILFLTLLAALGTAAETALVRMSRARAEALASDGRRGTAELVEVVDRRDTKLAPLLVIRVGSLLVIASVATTLVRRHFEGGVVLAVMAAIVIAVYIFAEAVPRIWVQQDPDRAALLAAPLVRALARIAPVRWLTRVLNGIANTVLPGPAGQPIVSEDELIAVTEAAMKSAAIDDGEREMITSALIFTDTIVREVMVPRTDMIIAESDKSVSEVVDLAIERGLSRLPVAGNGVDDIVGVSLVKDLIRADRSGHGDRSVRSMMRRPRFVPETKSVAELLAEMQSDGHHMAVVIDEYGGTAGLVTLEDLIEELVGEIVDEYDRESPLVEPLAGGELLVHGRMPVDQLNNLIDTHMPDGDWDTVGGLIFAALGHVPELGETIEASGVTLKVEGMKGRRITRVRLSKNVQAETPIEESML